RYFIKDLKTKTEVIHNGYDGKKWFCNSPKQKNTFITISGGLHTANGFVLKGVDMIFEMAPLFPDCEFHIVGGYAIKSAAPANVKLLQFIPNDEMQPLLSKMQFYLQLSLSEGFPNAVSESMLCECVPIVSAVGGMPDLVGDCGYILKHKNVTELRDMIGAALNNTDLAGLGKKARKRVEERFSFENRRKKMIAELEKLM
ncbi:MAG: glycosyltransferase family 4 protein, partial [Bacteroidia bacterium]